MWSKKSVNMKEQAMISQGRPIRQMLFSTVGVVLVSLVSVRADVPRELVKAQELIQEMLQKEMPQTQQKTKARPNVLETYDLALATDKVMQKITAGPEFSAYFEQRKAKLTPDQRQALDRKTQGMWMIEFAQTREDVKPEIKAWLYIEMAPFVPWDQALAAYYRLEKYRPKDFVPALALVFKLQSHELDPPTTEQWKNLLSIERQALPLVPNSEDMVDCVAAIGVGALKLVKPGSEQGFPLLVWQWMREVQAPEPQKESEDALRLNLVKMYVAMAAHDFRAAVDLAPLCRMRVFQPMLLVLGDNREEAYESLKTLRQDSTLTAPERVGLRKCEPLVLMFAHQFGEAWKILAEQRADPKLSAEDSKWLDTVEGLLRNYERAIQDRQNGKP
jgi:hypothetical protein